MKKRLVALALIVVFAAAVFAGCAAAPQPSVSPSASESVSAAPSESATPSASEASSAPATMLDKIKAKGELVVGTSADYPPYEFVDTTDGKNDFVGMDMSIAAEIAKELGVKLTVNNIGFDGLLPALASGKIDIVIAGMSPTDERKQSFDFSEIYYLAQQGVLVRTEDVEKYTTIDSLKGKSVGAQTGTIQADILAEQLKDSKPVLLQKVPDLILSLKSKKTEAMICELPVAENYVKQNPDLTVSKIAVEDDTGGSAIAVNKGNQEFIDFLNGVIKKLMDGGKISEFYAAAQALAEKQPTE